MVFDKLKQRRRILKKEAFELTRLATYLSRKELKDIKRQVKQNKASIATEKLPISFLISGENLIPKLAPAEQFESHNSKIKSRHFSKIQAEFSTRAYDVLPNFIAPDVVGLSVEKRAAVALLFSESLKILFIRHGREIIEFLDNFDLKSVAVRTSKLREGFDFVFRSKKPHASPLLVYEPSEVKQANIAFIKDYVVRARELSVNIPKELNELIEQFIQLRMGSEQFAESVRELARALARMEMRSKLLNKDLARAFEIASASAKR